MPGESFYQDQKALEHVQSRMYTHDFPALKWREQIPVNTEADAADEFISFETEEIVGSSRVSNSYDDSAPNVEVKVSKSPNVVVPMVTSFQYNIQDVRAAVKTGRSLPMRKALAAREVLERGLEELFFLGSSKHGIEGLLNNSNVTSVNAANPGAGTAWSTKTTDQKLADILDAIAAMQDATNGREGNVVDILLPDAQYTALVTARIDSTAVTALSYIMSNIPQVRSIRRNFRLKNISGTDERMVLYTQDPTKVEAHLPLDVLSHPAQLHGGIWSSMLEARAGGTTLYKPRSAYYVDKI